MNDTRPNLLDLTVEEIGELCLALGEKPYRAGQLSAWLFRRGADDFNLMTDIALTTRRKLEAAARIQPLKILQAAEDDEACKILWELEDGHTVESVLINERDHHTLCVSSQVGCALGCRFCRTGAMGFIRNLSQGEIVGQILGARKLAGPDRPVSNLVFMGMGEPLLNRENVMKSLRIITDSDLLAVAGKRISLSTVGIVPELPVLAQGPDIGLTVSLSAPDDRLRDQIMPVNKKYPLAALKEALAAWPLRHGRRITIAYVLLRDVNDSPDQALALSRFLTGLKVKVNLIPFNPWPGAPFEAPSVKAVEAFRDVLVKKHYTAVIRWSKGRKVAAACGQLSGERAALND